MRRAVWTRIIVYGGLISALVIAWAAWYLPARDKARLSSCQANLRQLRLAAFQYTEDYDGLLPPRPAQGDWMARRWDAFPMRAWGRRVYHLHVAEDGPLFPYLKNACVSRCPDDPDNRKATIAAATHSSYEWNYALAGKDLASLGHVPLLWERAPFHRHGRNVAYAMPEDPSQVQWMSERDFQALSKAPPAR